VDDIDVRPKKRRKPGYYYEVVAPCGEVVDVVDNDSDDSNEDSTQETRRSSRSTSAARTRPTSSRATSPETAETSDHSNHVHKAETTKEESGSSAASDLDTPTPAKRSHGEVEASPSTASDFLSSPPRTPLSPQSSKSAEPKTGVSVVVEIPTSSSKETILRSSSRVTAKHRPITALRKEESSLTTPEDEEPASQSSQTSRNSLPNMKGRDLFDAMIWSEAFTTSIFYMFITSLRQKVNEVKQPSETHKFLRVLRDGGRLVRNYTQNIDRLEEQEGLSTDLLEGPGNRARFHGKTQREARPSEIDEDSAHYGGVEVVTLHGSLNKLRCGICTKLADWDEERENTTLSGRAPDCPSCAEYNNKRTGKGRRGLAVGRLRPDIVLYGEEHPQNSLISPLVTHDLSLTPDVLLIMGTSLRVHGLKIMVREFAKAVHTKGGKVIFVNNTKPSESVWGDVIDYWVEWDCDAWVLDLKERRSDIWLPQGSQPERRESYATPRQPRTDGGRTREKRVDPPGYIRDDKTCGVYVTFKIMDQLREVQDGKPCQRKQYRKIRFQPQTYVNPNIAVVIDSRQTQTQTPKSEPKKRAQPAKAATNAKRKSLPASKTTKPSEDGRNYNAQVLITKTWEEIRRTNPALPIVPPAISAGILQQRCQNIPTTADKFMINTSKTHINANLFYGMGLKSHPPSGLVGTSAAALAPVVPLKPKPPPTNHAYGTRSSRSAHPSPAPPLPTPTPVEVPPCPGALEFSKIFLGSTPRDVMRHPMTPPNSNPSSDPPSDCEKRIKRLGSIENILSPVLPNSSRYKDVQPEVEGEGDVDSDQSQVFYDASETLAV
jgi:NAD-dependent SIR2 family protein deacetylase